MTTAQNPIAVNPVTGALTYPPGVGGSGSGGTSTVVSKTTTYTAASGEFVNANATSAGFTVTLPASPTSGDQVGVMKTDATANVVTVVATSKTINGDANATCVSQYAGAIFEYDGSNWFISGVTQPGGTSDPLAAQKSANLSDLASASTARTNLGLGTAATAATGTTSGTVPLLGTGGVLAIGRLATGTPDGTKFVRDDGTLVTPTDAGAAQKSANLSDLASASTARTNLGLGTAALISSTAGGDLSGTLPSPTVAKVNGVTITGTPTSGQVPTASSGTAAAWATPSGAAAFSGCKAYVDSNQTLSNTTVSALNMNAEDYDTDTYHNNSTNNSRLTVPSGKTGYFRLIGNVSFGSNATGLRQVRWRKNGSDVAFSFVTVPAANGLTTCLTASCDVAAVPTDYFELCAYQDSGGTLGSTSWGASIQFLGA